MNRSRISVLLGLTAVLLTSGCDMLARRQLRGTYRRLGKEQPMAINAFELTESHMVVTLPIAGQRAFAYHVEGDRVYVDDAQQVQFINEGYGILRNEGTPGFDGRFIKLTD